MESNKQNKLTNKIDTENRMAAGRGEGTSGLGEKGEGIKQRTTTTTTTTTRKPTHRHRL